MGVELALLAASYHVEHGANVFMYIDTSKNFSKIYDELFDMQKDYGIKPSKVKAYFTDPNMDLNETPYGDNLFFVDPRVLLKVIRDNIHKLAIKDEIINMPGEFYSDLEDEVTQMVIGLLEKLAIMETERVNIGLYWY